MVEVPEVVSAEHFQVGVMHCAGPDNREQLCDQVDCSALPEDYNAAKFPHCCSSAMKYAAQHVILPPRKELGDSVIEPSPEENSTSNGQGRHNKNRRSLQSVDYAAGMEICEILWSCSCCNLFPKELDLL